MLREKGGVLSLKKLFKVFAAILIGTGISGGIGIQAYAYFPVSNDSITAIVWPQSDIIEWRYKTENGKLYKRQYNCTKTKWIGSWQLVT